MGLFLPTLDKTMPIVTVYVKVLGMTVPIAFEGIATPRFMRFWQTNSLRLDGAATLAAVPTTAAATYDQAQFQAVLDFCNALRRGLSG